MRFSVLKELVTVRFVTSAAEMFVFIVSLMVSSIITALGWGSVLQRRISFSFILV